MDKNIAIRVDNISKHFKVFFDKAATMKELLLFSKRRRYEERQMLDVCGYEHHTQGHCGKLRSAGS